MPGALRIGGCRAYGEKIGAFEGVLGLSEDSMEKSELS